MSLDNADVDECSEGSHNCTTAADCINDIGAYHCVYPEPDHSDSDACGLGFRLDPVTQECQGMTKI